MCVCLEFGLSSLGFVECACVCVCVESFTFLPSCTYGAVNLLPVAGYWLPTSFRSILIVFCSCESSTKGGGGLAECTSNSQTNRHSATSLQNISALSHMVFSLCVFFSFNICQLTLFLWPALLFEMGLSMSTCEYAVYFLIISRFF